MHQHQQDQDKDQQQSARVCRLESRNRQKKKVRDTRGLLRVERNFATPASVRLLSTPYDSIKGARRATCHVRASQSAGVRGAEAVIGSWAHKPGGGLKQRAVPKALAYQSMLELLMDG